MFIHLRFYLLSFISLLAVTFGEKVLFAVAQSPLGEDGSLIELGQTLAWGIRFDLAAAAAFTLLSGTSAYLLFRLLRVPFARASEYASFVAAAVLILIHGADLLYFEESGRHLGYELKEGLNSGASLAAAAMETYFGAVLLQLALIALFFPVNRWLFRRLGTKTKASDSWHRFVLPEAQWFIMLLISVVLVRGGLQSVPLEPLHAQEIGNASRAALTLNGTYNALFSSITPYSIEPVLGEQPTAADRAQVQALYASASVPPAPWHSKPPNVVFVLLESWAAQHMSAYGFDLPTTPVFEALRAKGLTTDSMFADGLRTTEGIFATFCSAQNPLGATVAQTQLQNYDYDCLPEILARRGYGSAFFQGTLENTSGTGAFAQLLGFEESYGKTEMPAPQMEPNSWGHHDPDIYRFARERMRKMDQPFLVGINTNSTHDKRVTSGIEPVFGNESRTEGYLSVLHFADQALGEFIDSVRADPEIGETIFVLLADHTGLKTGDIVRDHTIPFVLYAPQIEPRRIARPASQRDIAPTLLDLLGLDTPSWFTGKSLLRNDEEPYFADFYHAGRLGWLENDRLVTFPVKKPEQRQCYTYAAISMAKQRVPCDAEGDRQQVRALAFTRVFQQLLFSGDVRGFGQLKDGSKSPLTGFKERLKAGGRPVDMTQNKPAVSKSGKLDAL